MSLDKPVRILADSTVGHKTSVSFADGSEIPLKIRKVEATFSVDDVNRATLHAVGVTADALVEAKVVCDCPHCGKQLKVL